MLEVKLKAFAEDKTRCVCETLMLPKQPYLGIVESYLHTQYEHCNSNSMEVTGKC